MFGDVSGYTSQDHALPGMREMNATAGEPAPISITEMHGGRSDATVTGISTFEREFAARKAALASLDEVERNALGRFEKADRDVVGDDLADEDREVLDSLFDKGLIHRVRSGGMNVYCPLHRSAPTTRTGAWLIPGRPESLMTGKERR